MRQISEEQALLLKRVTVKISTYFYLTYILSSKLAVKVIQLIF